jgi:hypothetical protein
MTAKTKSIAFSAIATLGICFTQTAYTACTNIEDQWVCRDSSVKCHIEKARYYPPSATQYLLIELDDTVDHCKLIKFVTPNKACTGDAYTDGALRNLESIALTSMTTGLPVYFFVTERDDDLCIAKTMVIYRP